METKYKKNLTLDDFLLFSVIGKGSFAKVLLVQRKSTGKNYALKVIKRDQVGKKKQEEHIKTERNALVFSPPGTLLIKHYVLGLRRPPFRDQTRLCIQK